MKVDILSLGVFKTEALEDLDSYFVAQNEREESLKEIEKRIDARMLLINKGPQDSDDWE